MKPLADHLAVANDNRTHERIWTDSPPPTLSEGERALQEIGIGG
jgi:hypothetical protein